MTQTVIDFNNTLLSLAQNIASVCPSSLVGTNIREIEKAIKNKNNFTKFIDLFCIKVLQYKDKIDNGEEQFFMDKDYKNDLADIENSNESYLEHVLTMKSVWSQLKKENREIVMLNMQILCSLAQDYFDFTIKNM